MAFKLRAGVSLAETDDGIAVLDEDRGEYFSLNPTGALVLRTMLDGGTCEQAAQRLVTEYDVDQATALQDANELVADLRAAGLVHAGEGLG
jgi:Coenzyme PQQ synthesis protein D (PqqD)